MAREAHSEIATMLVDTKWITASEAGIKSGRHRACSSLDPGFEAEKRSAPNPVRGVTRRMALPAVFAVFAGNYQRARHRPPRNSSAGEGSAHQRTARSALFPPLFLAVLVQPAVAKHRDT